MKFQRFIIIILSLIIIFCNYNLALACSCSNTNEAEKIRSLKQADLVFQGEVISVSEPVTEELKNSKGVKYGNWQFLYIDFKVIKVWKGTDSETVRIKMGHDSCSLQYKIGDNPFVVASGKPLMTDMCTRGSIEPERFNEIFGEPKLIEQPQPSPTETTEGFWASLWNKITSFFS